MKHTKKKRLLAIVLCMILVLSTGIAAFANENVGLQSVACQAATLERVIKNAEGEDVGTLIADIPEGTFLASSSDANIQMDVQADVGADGVLDRVQQQLEANGETGYTLNNYVMADVTFYVNGEKQVPQQPITFTVKGTNLDSQKTVAFSDDRQNNPTFPDVTEVTAEDGSKALQFTADMDSETSVFGVTEALQDKEWSTQVGNATVKVTGTEDALPEGAQLTVSEITAENEKEAIENAVMEQENDDSAVTNIVAYDIKFMMNGQEVQPSSPVQVSVDSPQIVSDQDTSVYHVDENNSVEDMDGSVDADGNIVFDAPHFSTYVIVQKGENAVNVTIQHYDATKTTETETVAPDGYVASATTWKVNVTVNGETATATLYQADGTTAVTPVNGVYNIQNQTQEEHTQMILDYDKTAHVTNWDNRIYDIDITASSKLTSQTTEESGGEADVMLVLDTSGSMGDDGKMTALKNAAKQFVTNTATKSATSKIGITAFSSSGYNKDYGSYKGSHGKSTELLTVGDNQTELTSFIDNLIANGGTDPAVGLNEAYSKLKSAKENGDTLPKYVILFTDGEPTGGGSTWSTTAQTNAEASAQKLKEMGVTVYTIGFGLKDKASAFLAGGEYKTWNWNYGWTTTIFPGIASSGCAKTADDANSLLDIFNKISETITNNLEITGAKIVDAIDPKFIILDDKGVQITEEYLTSKNIESVTLANGGKVYYKEGIQYIEWTDQTIPNKNNNAEWHKTITVQAQRDYIGGNNVATNISPDSKITTSYGEGVLPQPRVNVKAKLELNDKNVTIYKGDDVPSAETVLNDMVQNYAKNTGKYGVATDSFSVNWYTAEALEKKFDASTRIEDLKVIGTKVENDTTYYLTVTYDAGAPTDESNANTTENGEVKIAGDRTTHTVVATSVNDSNRTYGIYNIHVISGTIKITKKLVDLSNEDQTFTFVVKKDSEIVATVPLTVRKGEKEASFTGDVLTNLPRGTYTVEEQNTSGYVLNEAKSGTETNCENSVIPTYVARFVLGNSKATENKYSENVIKDYTYDPNDGGTVGQAVFTNEKVITDWDIVKVSASSDTLKLEGAQFTLKDSNGNVRYTGTSNANGKIEWKEKGVAVSTLAQGTYEFQETKAPAGYSVSAEKWTILIASNGYLKSIKKADGTEVIAQPTTSEDSVVHYYYEDNALYELPHTGGPGIYLFTIGGILLMGAAAWILYKNKCREVLKR